MPGFQGVQASVAIWPAVRRSHRRIIIQFHNHL